MWWTTLTTPATCTRNLSCYGGAKQPHDSRRMFLQIRQDHAALVFLFRSHRSETTLKRRSKEAQLDAESTNDGVLTLFNAPRSHACGDVEWWRPNGHRVLY